MIKSIDISDFTEESYVVNDWLEIWFSEDGNFIMAPEAMFEVININEIIKQSENSYVLINKEGEKLELNKEQYDIIEKLFEEKQNASNS
jgi:hypothetical protein